MSDTAVAVEAAVTEAFDSTPAPEAPAIVRREDLREQILNAEWKEEAELTAPAMDAEVEGVEGELPSDDPTLQTAEGGAPDLGEPPPEAVIGEGGNRVLVRSPDGKFAPAPDVKLEFQVGDKVYLKSPAELVRMAKDGVAGQHYYQEAQQLRTQVPQLMQQYEAMQQELEAQRALNLEILNDETAYLQRRDEWSVLNSPEERLRRYEAQRQQEMQQQQAAQEAAQRQQVVLQYYEHELKPVQDDILNNFPQVTLEAKLGRISIDTAPLMSNGVIPPHRLPEYKAYLAGPFREWVKHEAARVEQAQAAAAAQLKATIRQGQQRAQQVVQSVGKSLAPTGQRGPDVPKPAPKPRNREEAKMAIINRAWDG